MKTQRLQSHNYSCAGNPMIAIFSLFDRDGIYIHAK